MPCSGNDCLDISNNTPEANRLYSKQETITAAQTTQERVIAMNQNFSKINMEYIKIMVTVVVGMMVILVYKCINMYVPLPTWIGTLLYVLVIVTVILVSGNIYLTIMGRNPNDFDKLNLSIPMGMGGGSANVNALTGVSGNTGNNQFCVGSACCGASATWDQKSGSCIPSLIQGFTQQVTQKKETGTEWEPFSTKRTYRDL